MLAAAYKIKLLKKKDIYDEQDMKDLQRKFRNHKNEFAKISRQIRNITDPDADMETMKSGVDLL